MFEEAAGHVTGDVRFVSAGTCASVRFVRVRDGAIVDAARYEAWVQEAPHSVRVLRNARQYEAHPANTGIQE